MTNKKYEMLEFIKFLSKLLSGADKLKKQQSTMLKYPSKINPKKSLKNSCYFKSWKVFLKRGKHFERGQTIEKIPIIFKFKNNIIRLNEPKFINGLYDPYPNYLV